MGKDIPNMRLGAWRARYLYTRVAIVAGQPQYNGMKKKLLSHIAIRSFGEHARVIEVRDFSAHDSHCFLDILNY